jgi:peptidoglycan/LPS O-acetylase OafA/YrhL
MNAGMRPRLPALTTLRFFAAFHVMLFHTQAMGAVFGPEWFRRISSIGYVGVSFFFVLSGFILVYTYADKPLRARDFWQARFARVYPAYAFALVLTLPFFLWSASHYAEIKLPFMAFEAAHFKTAAILEIALLQAWIPPAALSWNAVGWSLSVEVLFYLLFPFLLAGYRCLARVQLVALILGCWVLSNAVSLAYTVLRPDGIAHPDANVYTSWMNIVKFFPLVRLPEFLMGMAAGFLFLQRRRKQSGTMFIAVGTLAVAAVSALADRIPYAVIHTALLAPAFAALIYGTALHPKWLSILESKALVVFGEASYSVYLIHSNVVFAFFHNARGDVRNANFFGLAGCLTIVLAIAILIYRFIEQPARARLRPGAKARPGLAAAAAAS